MPNLQLWVANPMPPGSLATLLSTLQPAGTAPHPFHSLRLSGPITDPAAVAGFPQLAQLDELSWDAPACKRSLAALLQQATSLRSLAFECCDPNLGAVHACLASYHGLTRLGLRRQGLSELPT